MICHQIGPWDEKSGPWRGFVSRLGPGTGNLVFGENLSPDWALGGDFWAGDEKFDSWRGFVSRLGPGARNLVLGEELSPDWALRGDFWAGGTRNLILGEGLSPGERNLFFWRVNVSRLGRWESVIFGWG